VSARNLVFAFLASAASVAARADAAQVRATRATGAIAVDGRLDEPDWARAEPFSGFVQVFPGEGAPPNEATEVRILYGEKALYVGVLCRDGRPMDIVRPLGRRDRPPASDNVTVLVDSQNDHRSALLFSLTAGGVQSDGLVYDDDRITYEWDAPWEGAVSISDDGWSAEFAIPLSVMSYRPAADQPWGFGIIREVARSHERSATFPLPRNASGMVTRLGTLGGLADVQAQAGIDVMPYFAQRLQLRPQFSDPSRPRPRLADASGDAGVDLRGTLGRLSFSGTVNPDFGQVEADEVILNLSTFEPFFPEKRPFFTQGADAFQPVGAGRETVPQQLFYSRRIGLDAPILGAAKLVGQPGEGLKIGLLDAVVTGAGQASGASEEAPDRRMAWSSARPFHVGPADANPLVAPVTQNFFAGVARLRLNDEVVVGAQAVSAMPLAEPCTAAQDAATDGTRPASCDAAGGDAAALDFSAASRDGVWYAYGQVAGSRIEGGPPARTLRDGTVLRRGDAGTGTYFRAGKRGGEGFRMDLAWTYASPRLDLNPAGFQRTQNEQEGGTTLKYARTNLGPFHELTVLGGGYGRWTTDGRGLSRGWGAAAGVDAQLKDPYLWVSFRVRRTDPMYDVREIAGTGIPLRRPATEEVTLDVSTDPARSVSADLGGYVGRNVRMGELDAPAFHGASAGVKLRPHPRLETRVTGAYDYNTYPVRFVEEDGAGALTFAALRAPTLSLTLRQLVVVTPRLTVQLYAQLFTAYESWGSSYSATPRGTAPIEPGALSRAAPPAFDPDAHTSALVVNAVVRWEYRTGSTLYAVYARNQAELPLGSDQAVPHVLAPRGLGPGPTTDAFLLKWAYRFAG
jgi:Domain of unknown function (DUF5916)